MCSSRSSARFVSLLLSLAGSLSLAVAQSQFQFRMPEPVEWSIETSPADMQLHLLQDRSWIAGYPSTDDSEQVSFGSRVVLQTLPDTNLDSVLAGGRSHLVRALPDHTWILQAPDAHAAVVEAHRLSQTSGVRVSYPVMRRDLRLHGPYARLSNDPRFDQQWYLENRAADGTPSGADLNVRAAWPFSLGEGVMVAIVDDGVELTHPEFVQRVHHDLHFNFGTGSTNSLPTSLSDNHGTTVAGLALAERGNRVGIAGVAPAAQIASWKIFQGSTLTPTDEQMMDMFHFRSNHVAVQNHSWGNASVRPTGPTFLERIGISNAIHSGRAGRGVLMIRSAGNGRQQSSNVNDDAYASDPNVIAVAAVRRDGRVTDYSNPGAAILVAAPGGAPDGNLLTTDRQGTRGFNTGTFPDDFADYVSSSVVRGTSFAAPQVSGLVALLLSVNPELTVRDVQLILALSSRHVDLNDPDLHTNGAGLWISHNVGFGVPDAGHAISLARNWVLRPPATELTQISESARSIPDDGLRVRITNDSSVPSELSSIPSTSGLGPHPDTTSESLPLVDVGLADRPIPVDLTGHAALIQRGDNLFSEKLHFVADAGASFAIVRNHTGTDSRLVMGATEFTRIPAVLIGKDHGDSLSQYLLQQPNARAQLRLEAARYGFPVTRALVCEHVSVRVRTTHSRRGDLRITLVSPMGTRSVMQHQNQDSNSGPSNWTYHSVHHFLESSVGTWLVEISDQQPSNQGTVTSVELTLRGVEIQDSDRDGLDDRWELQTFGTLAFGPRDDPDRDGYNNAIEQVLQSDPLAPNSDLQLNLSAWNEDWIRISWPGVHDRSYELLTGLQAAQPLSRLVEIPGRFPVTEWFVPRSDANDHFFQLMISESELD
jgi:subtilisin family serine protease/subtilisin-like proprotein convertase family protein